MDPSASGTPSPRRPAVGQETFDDALERIAEVLARLSNTPNGGNVVVGEAALPSAPVTVPGPLRDTVVATLRDAGARFALLHGSRAAGTHREDSDVDVAAWWGSGAPSSFEVDLPRGVDLVVLDTAPLELAGRIAVDGLLLFDDDPPARVRWIATTRKIWFDERPRFERAHREFLESLRRGR